VPILSVLMSVFNGEKFLLSAIRSIQSQSYKDFEAIIVDDGSNDSTSLIIQSVLNQDKRFKGIVNISNLGLPISLNLASNESLGEYKLFMGLDDLLGAIYLQSMLKEIRLHKADFIYSDYCLIDENGNHLGISRVEDSHLLVCGMAMGVSRVWRRDLLQNLGGFNPNTFMYEDYESDDSAPSL
jgi:glycosyltransferase involved in cell wall biosynthesis